MFIVHRVLSICLVNCTCLISQVIFTMFKRSCSLKCFTVHGEYYIALYRWKYFATHSNTLAQINIPQKLYLRALQKSKLSHWKFIDIRLDISPNADIDTVRGVAKVSNRIRNHWPRAPCRKTRNQFACGTRKGNLLLLPAPRPPRNNLL